MSDYLSDRGLRESVPLSTDAPSFPADYEARLEALRLANGSDPADEVVARAERYRAFLMGEVGDGK